MSNFDKLGKALDDNDTSVSLRISSSPGGSGNMVYQESVMHGVMIGDFFS